MKRARKAFFLMAALVLMAGLWLAAAGPAGACSDFTLTIATDGHGWTDPSGTDSYEYGDDVWVDAYADNCYQFDYWSGDVDEGNEYDNPVLIHMCSNKLITAHFKAVVNCPPGPEPSPEPTPIPTPAPTPTPTPAPAPTPTPGVSPNTGYVPATLVSLEVIPGNATIQIGASKQFTAWANYNDSSRVDVTEQASWDSANASIATVSSGSAKGVTEGTTNITATLQGKSDDAILSVITPPPSVLSVEVQPGSAAILVGGAQQFTATAHYSDSTSANVTNMASWISTNKGAASIDGVGLATGVAAGITGVKATFDGVTSNPAILTVTAPQPTVLAVVVEPDSASIVAGGTHQFTATAHYSDSTSADVTNIASWDSSVVGVATLASGLATGVAAGVTDIAATYSGVLSNPAALTVTAPKPTVQTIAVDPGNATVSIGGTQQFTATAYYSDGSSKEATNEATWESSDKSVATIDNVGLATGADVGNAQITASLEGVSSNPVLVSVVPVSVPWAMIGGIIAAALALGLLLFFLLRRRRRGAAEDEA